MRIAFAAVAAVSLLAGCRTSTMVTAPAAATATLSGSWSGCFTPGSCSLSMTLTDSAETDTTGLVRGAGNWVSSVTIQGTRTDSTVTLHATETGQTLGWSFTGALSGSSVAGHMTGPSIDSTAQVTFTRSP